MPVQKKISIRTKIIILLLVFVTILVPVWFLLRYLVEKELKNIGADIANHVIPLAITPICEGLYLGGNALEMSLQKDIAKLDEPGVNVMNRLTTYYQMVLLAYMFHSDKEKLNNEIRDKGSLSNKPLITDFLENKFAITWLDQDKILIVSPGKEGDFEADSSGFKRTQSERWLEIREIDNNIIGIVFLSNPCTIKVTVEEEMLKSINQYRKTHPLDKSGQAEPKQDKPE
ncbi:hypothetical protein ACFL5I_01560 [Planctomycetota bacterium]